MNTPSQFIRSLILAVLGIGAFLSCLLFCLSGNAGQRVSASSSQAGWDAPGTMDGDRFSCGQGHGWRGTSNGGPWWWQVEFAALRKIGSILQITGDHAFVFTNAPACYVWQTSNDGIRWHNLLDASILHDSRLYRIHRLTRAELTRFLRLQINEITGSYPTVREVEFYEDSQARIAFPEWIVVVNTTHDARLPGHGQEFIPLAKSCAGWNSIQAQQVWLADFNETLLASEPRPLAGFLSGNFKDWCEVDRQWWRGVQEVLRRKHLPMWASCGGGQGLALLSEYGFDRPWDCPHCRDPRHPRTPIYTHIGHTDQRPCGDYSACVFERGKFTLKQLARDPVLAGLPREFVAMESHCGQIAWPPRGWDLLITAGPGAKTATQCLRLHDRYIYAAQFHIEMEGTPETSRLIMSNFLDLAKAWGGYNPRGRSVAPAPHWQD
jgi:hypothetical protein